MTGPAPAAAGEAAADPIAAARLRPAARPDPRTVLLFLLTANVLALGAPTLSVPTAAMACAVALLAVAGRLRAAVRFALVFLICFGAAVAAPRLAANGLTAAVSLFGFWFGRFSVAIAAGWWAVTSLKPTELIEALRRLRLPNAVVVPLAVVLRVLPVIAVEAAAVIDAMTLRGLRPDSRGLAAHPVRTGELVLIPLLTTVVRAGDELAAAAMVRGLGAPTRPRGIAPLGPRAIDAVVLAMIAALLLANYGGWGLP
ncbi:energy-coupling factor transporter transmembrane component T [Corynebacterium sphenisci]|uniref:energy-coupling factor transporter transmembrane component T n=1 Tax=Corynebacterium sphenisci TaxID=191493 RepID=UPI0026E0F734|nr:energy-coupling factor transporter transmembrane component T [Corynebacterium sphenisci]MDO5731797.1 energy-coupling factor transporter transmembrane component T [Corynebacterium sphenisci]